MSKIRVLSDHVINQIAAGEVVERPASVAKELVENSIDAGARRVEVDVEAGGRRLLRVADDGEGMTRDDAVLAFERHATSKISSTEDLDRLATLGFRGEALASIASVARVELVTCTEGAAEGTRVQVEGGRMRDVAPAARPRGTTISVRDLFFNVPARRKFLRSEATESFHLTNLVTHYALAHPEIAFTLTNGGREVLRAAPAASLRERAYQIFGAPFLENLLEVDGAAGAARVGGYVSAPRERRTTRDAQFLFVNGRYVRDRLVARALGEAYRSVLPQGTYPAALLFLELPPEEVDVNVHPAKTEVRFRRAAAVAESVRASVRAALAAAGFLRLSDSLTEPDEEFRDYRERSEPEPPPPPPPSDEHAPQQDSMEFGWTPAAGEDIWSTGPSALRPEEVKREEEHAPARADVDAGAEKVADARPAPHAAPAPSAPAPVADGSGACAVADDAPRSVEPERASPPSLPPLGSAGGLLREAEPGALAHGIRPLGQLDDSFIVAADPDGLLLIDQHVAHERILFDKYRRLADTRRADSQATLVPETFDLTPAQAAAFDHLAPDLEHYGFELTRLSGRTVAIRAFPADLPHGEARNLLAEILDSVDSEKRGRAGAALRETLAASLACRAAVKSNTPLTHEKMRWLVDRLLQTSSPTTCPHGRPIILRLSRRDIDRALHRT